MPVEIQHAFCMMLYGFIFLKFDKVEGFRHGFFLNTDNKKMIKDFSYFNLHDLLESLFLSLFFLLTQHLP